jgi:hypothetical protein
LIGSLDGEVDDEQRGDDPHQWVDVGGAPAYRLDHDVAEERGTDAAENDTSAFRKPRVPLPDGTHGYRVVRPVWDETLPGLRRGSTWSDPRARPE